MTETKTLHIKPARKDLRVPDPDDANKAPLPAKGKVVANSPHWQRRLRAGDVVMVAVEEKPTLAPASRQEPKGNK
ncbi:MAG: DUF2635 domain-containing protein [Gammaproteobacteria bacterium]|nr:DUF2635 domain-containing protein [Gammaproteobacteria bacterium]